MRLEIACAARSKGLPTETLGNSLDVLSIASVSNQVVEDGPCLEVAGLRLSVVAELSVNVLWRDRSELLVLLIRDRKNLSHMHKRGAGATLRVGI